MCAKGVVWTEKYKGKERDQLGGGGKEVRGRGGPFTTWASVSTTIAAPPAGTRSAGSMAAASHGLTTSA